MRGFKVEYSEDGNEVCIIPNPLIPFPEFIAIIKTFKKQKYKYWLPADDRRGYIFSKTKSKSDV